MKKLLRKKLFKIVPLWLILVLVALPLAAATIVVISNTISMYATVSNAPIKLNGTFDSTVYRGITSSSSHTYEIQATAGYSGYLKLSFGGSISSESDISVEVWLNPGTGTSQQLGLASAPYYGGTSASFIFGAPSSNPSARVPITFGSTVGGTGTITVRITPASNFASDNLDISMSAVPTTYLG
jgi:hypothetical protein